MVAGRRDTPRKPSRSSSSCFRVSWFCWLPPISCRTRRWPASAGDAGGRLRGPGGASVPRIRPDQRPGVDRRRAGVGAGSECQQCGHDPRRRTRGPDRPDAWSAAAGVGSSLVLPGLLATLLGLADPGDRLARWPRRAAWGRAGALPSLRTPGSSGFATESIALWRSHLLAFGGASAAGDEEPAGGQRATGNLAGREQLYPALWTMFLEKPVLGWGPVTNTYELALRIGERDRPHRAAHNIVLELLTASGLVGHSRSWWASGSAAREAWRARDGEHGVLPLALWCSRS